MQFFVYLDGILRNIQEDANQRAQRRKENEANSEELKLKGNKEFKAGNYKIAIDYYSRAIGLVKYFPALYTNRAQVKLFHPLCLGVSCTYKQIGMALCKFQ